MKINRLIEITTLLLNHQTVTAGELAERFGVSTRTIYRDIDDLSAAGIPVCSTQGAGGGISIMEHYALNRTALDESDRKSLLLAMQTLRSTRYPDADKVMAKLGSLFQVEDDDWITADFTTWGSDPDSDHRFTDIRRAILQRLVIEIDYISADNRKTTRQVEPLQLVFKDRAWYLRAYCRARRAERLFRLSRIRKAAVTDQVFDRRSRLLQREKENRVPSSPPLVHLVLRFTERALFRLCDDYDSDQIRSNGDGSYTLEMEYPMGDWVTGYLLSFGPDVWVESPAWMQRILMEKSRQVWESYRPCPLLCEEESNRE